MTREEEEEEGVGMEEEKEEEEACGDGDCPRRGLRGTQQDDVIFVRHLHRVFLSRCLPRRLDAGAGFQKR